MRALSFCELGWLTQWSAAERLVGPLHQLGGKGKKKKSAALEERFT
jgi:hypothetical protein